MQAWRYARWRSHSSTSENSVIIACCGVDRPAVWFSATSRLSATSRSMKRSVAGSGVSVP